ncbi:hypothetical protein C348_05309 [Cryptococcus neoformans Gb118]|nr:hypothetical protein C348_05309 [Cryptococcus neoformans var. grubii Gb118]
MSLASSLTRNRLATIKTPPPGSSTAQFKPRLASFSSLKTERSLPKASTPSQDVALGYDGWKEAWEEFIGEDELHLDVLEVLDVTADDLQLNTSY